MRYPNGVERLIDVARDETSEGIQFLKVVIAAGLALIVILIAAVVVVGGTGKNLVPQDKTAHPLSQVVMYQSTTAA